MSYLIKLAAMLVWSAPTLLLQGQDWSPYTFERTTALTKDAPFDWPDRLDGTEAKITLDQVRGFFAMLHPDLPGSIEPAVSGVEDFTFVKGGGVPVALVATLDFSDHGYFTSIEVVFCAHHECRIFGFHSDMENHLSEQVGRFTERAEPQLLVQFAPSNYRKYGQRVFTYYLYTIYPDGPKDVSASSKDFFATKIRPKWQKLREEYAQEKDAEFRRISLAQLDYCEIDYERRILGNAQAGLDQALEWGASDDSELRALGLQLIMYSVARNDAPRAVQMLRTLALSRNSDTAHEAEENLKSLMDSLDNRTSREKQ